VINYLKQVEICQSVQNAIKQALAKSNDPGMRLKTANFPTTESILRAVSLLPNLNSEEKLRDFITEHISKSLHLTRVDGSQYIEDAQEHS
jgi:hypothetical protein